MKADDTRNSLKVCYLDAFSSIFNNYSKNIMTIISKSIIVVNKISFGVEQI